jgi:hypothetical protein
MGKPLISRELPWRHTRYWQSNGRCTMRTMLALLAAGGLISVAVAQTAPAPAPPRPAPTDPAPQPAVPTPFPDPAPSPTPQ